MKATVAPKTEVQSGECQDHPIEAMVTTEKRGGTEMRMWTLFALILVGSVSASWAADLTGDQIKEKLIGHDLKWKSEKYKASGVSRYNPDGSMTVKMEGQDKTESGTWRIKGNNLCDKVGKQKETCSTRVDQITDTVFYMEPYQSIAIVQP